MQTKTSLLIIGAGMATGRLLDEICRRNPRRFDITVVGDEIHGSYNRIMLSSVLAEEVVAHAIIGKPSDWFKAKGIRFIGGRRAIAIDRDQKMVVLDDGAELTYDELVLATGSRPAQIAATNQHLHNIYSFRTLQDVSCIAAAAEAAHSRVSSGRSARAIVVGGGLLGLEAAYGLAKKGLPVTLVHRSGWLLNRQLDAGAAGYLRRVMEAKNISFELGAEVSSFTGSKDVSGAQLTNGRFIECDLAVIATGISPNKELGLAAGLVGSRGVRVDEFMRTSDRAISAIGECTEYEGETFGLVDPIWQQCITLADRLSYEQMTPFSSQPVATKLKVSGVQLFSAGEHLTSGEHRELLLEDPGAGIYRKLLLREDRVVGIVLFGDTRDGPEYFSMMQDRADISLIAATLVLGKAFCSEVGEAIAA